MRSVILPFAFLLALITSLACLYPKLVQTRPTLSAEQQHQLEVLLLPSGKALRLLSLGYENAFADLLWFKTISYFGKHYRSDQDYRWFGHMCDLVSSLDARRKHVYEFCGTLLAWEAQAPEKALALLNRAVGIFPDYWRFYYLRGFTYMYFLEDEQKAKEDFVFAAKLPDVPPFVARMAAKKIANLQDPRSAVTFLTEIITQSKDPYQVKALQKRLKESRYEADLQALDQAVQIFKQREQRAPRDLQELQTAGIIGSVPQDPFGGTYYLDADSGEAKSSSNRKRLTKRTRQVGHEPN